MPSGHAAGPAAGPAPRDVDRPGADLHRAPRRGARGVGKRHRRGPAAPCPAGAPECPARRRGAPAGSADARPGGGAGDETGTGTLLLHVLGRHPLPAGRVCCGLRGPGARRTHPLGLHAVPG